MIHLQSSSKRELCFDLSLFRKWNLLAVFPSNDAVVSDMNRRLHLGKIEVGPDQDQDKTLLVAMTNTNFSY